MRRIIFLLSLIIYSYNFCAPSIPGSVIGELLLPDDIIRYRLQFTQDKAFYVNGGLTFTFPFTFPNTPRVLTSAEGIFDPTIAYTVEIESVSTTNVIIRVHRIAYDGISTTTVAEASNDEVIVTIFALSS